MYVFDEMFLQYTVQKMNQMSKFKSSLWDSL